MKNTKTLIVDKTDLIKVSENKKIADITLEDLRTKSFVISKNSDIVIVVNDEGHTAVIKNRFGDCGVVVSESVYKKLPNRKQAPVSKPSLFSRFINSFKFR